VVKAASVCDNGQGQSYWQCEDASGLAGSFLRLVKNIVPSASVTRQVTDRVVRRDSDPYQSLQNGEAAWWRDVVSDVNKLYNASDAAADASANRLSMYYGMVRRDPFNGKAGGVTLFPSAGSTSHAAAGAVSVQRLGNEVNFEVLAHETGHSLGVRHTNKGPAPSVSHSGSDEDSYASFNRDDDDSHSSSSTAGCYGFAADSATDWPFADNRIQSQARLEVGFDVGRKRPLDPNANFETSSYCTPRWISPFNYKKMFSLMTAPAPAPAVSAGQFWQVSGSVQNSTVTLDPLFQFSATGSTAPGSGTYSIVVRDASSNVLFTRQFTPLSAETETGGTDFVAAPTFSELVPVQANAKTISVLSPSQANLQTITLGGVPPLVAFLTPLPFFPVSGTQIVDWIAFKFNASLTSRLQYSVDGGNTWDDLGQTTTTAMNVNFDNLPGANQALVRVLVSDGVNTGSATSLPFRVTRKSPESIEIASPTSNSYWAAADPVYLSGSVFDADDGDLAGAALQWTSNRQGALGSGSDLWVTLQPGQHRITLTGTDSDGNKVTASTTVNVADQPPAVTVNVSGPQLTINAAPGANGAPITSVMYTVDGGNTWRSISTNSLPFRLTVSVPTDLVAEAQDAAGQWGLGEGKALQAALTVTVSPSTFTLPITGTKKFTATVNGSSNQNVIWMVNPNVGFIDTTGLYTATFAHPVPQTVTVTAFAAVNTNVSGSATITVTAGPPTFLASINGNGQSTQVKTQFGSPLVVIPIDTAGNPVPGAAVTFTAPALSGASVTFQSTGTNTATVNANSAGTATSPLMTANGIAGPIAIGVTSGSANPTTFFITSTAGPAAAMTPAAGSTPQSASAGAQFAQPLAVKVVDAFGNTVSGVAVTFTAPPDTGIATGTFAGGSNTVTVNSDQNGLATATAFTANASTGSYTVTAAAGTVNTSFALQNQ
jgi:hypothetical protein